ncbi:helix-turn-helix transcriptional regulator [Erwinia psidii]|uniref:AraC family transcriptional regulator n=1 Tax=Erwinia psidii TaxID=69224 RepID=A0A3N6S8M9_9GAMM|nr:AraC family transcriptional regulator [Erwinia psidii]MCX8959523.1 AraC family transcriptional regulator [Erwinia psidii]MCX8963170.1 AraC family transcriptional regulator [Erwinia psidii]MCX8966951.1 AraC family transcriptional regulator [Erwinia psidii]RQM36483.1 AraC family transcriptional regulator [Erwinia psidii]
MTVNAQRVSVQPALKPHRLQEEHVAGIQEEWRHVVHMYQPCDGLGINCINGRPGSKWAFNAEGPPAFSINILIEGRMQAAFDNGTVLDARAGTAIMMATGQYATGWDVLDGKSEGAFRMVSIHMQEAAVAGLTGLQLDDLRQRITTVKGNQAHIDAFLGSMPASSALQRLACGLLGFECSWPGACISRDIYLRAKALEVLACFLRENITQQQIKLPVPADRSLLNEARVMLEKDYGKEWSVQSLSRLIGLNEKRLQSGFHAMFGCSVHACLTRIRLDAAVTMLQRGASVTETAACCGFGNLSHFSRVFRNHTGISPKQCALGITPDPQHRDTGIGL